MAACAAMITASPVFASTHACKLPEGKAVGRKPSVSTEGAWRGRMSVRNKEVVSITVGRIPVRLAVDSGRPGRALPKCNKRLCQSVSILIFNS